ncbi:putative ABC transporter ATP-binding protein [Candidatus Entotheonellaceae bacterium PAL068K]
MRGEAHKGQAARSWGCSRARSRALQDGEQRYGKVYDSRIMRRLWPFVAPYKAGLGLAAVCMLGGALSHLAAPYVIKLTLDGTIAHGDLAALTLMTFLYAGNAIAGWALQYGQTLYMARTAQRVLLEIRRALFQHLMRLDLAFHDRQSVGRLMSRVQNDVGALQDLFASGLLTTLGDVLILGGTLAVMLSMHPTLTLITCAVVPLILLLTFFWRRRSRRAFQQVRVALARVNARLQENISGIRVIQSLVSEDHNLQRFTEVNRACLETHLDATRLTALLFPAIEGVSVVAIILVLVFGGPMALAGDLSAGSLVAFVLYMLRFFEPIRDLSYRWNYLQMAMASGTRILAVLDTDVQITEAPHPVRLPRLRGEVTFEQVQFQYLLELPVLQDVSMHVAAGQRLALVGPTGAGKTTLANLVARFYDVTGGTVRIDGVDVRQLSFETLHRQIGLVLQEPFLFSGTVRDNLRYGHPEASDADLVAATQALGVHDHIMRLARGYDTDVHERGELLSRGQRQLISFVRALLADPRILIFDEATASIDTETERLLQSGLATLLRGRTAFIIAHRLSTVQHADRIIVLDQGRLVQDGTHAELLQQGGLYYRLYTTSFAGLEVRNA